MEAVPSITRTHRFSCNAFKDFIGGLIKGHFYVIHLSSQNCIADNITTDYLWKWLSVYVHIGNPFKYSNIHNCMPLSNSFQNVRTQQCPCDINNSVLYCVHCLFYWFRKRVINFEILFIREQQHTICRMYVWVCEHHHH